MSEAEPKVHSSLEYKMTSVSKRRARCYGTSIHDLQCARTKRGGSRAFEIHGIIRLPASTLKIHEPAAACCSLVGFEPNRLARQLALEIYNSRSSAETVKTSPSDPIQKRGEKFLQISFPRSFDDSSSVIVGFERRSGRQVYIVGGDLVLAPLSQRKRLYSSYKSKSPFIFILIARYNGIYIIP